MAGKRPYHLNGSEFLAGLIATLSDEQLKRFMIRRIQKIPGQADRMMTAIDVIALAHFMRLLWRFKAGDDPTGLTCDIKDGIMHVELRGPIHNWATERLPRCTYHSEKEGYPFTRLPEEERGCQADVPFGAVRACIAEKLGIPLEKFYFGEHQAGLFIANYTGVKPLTRYARNRLRPVLTEIGLSFP